MNTNELTQKDLRIIAFGLEDHIDMLTNAIDVYKEEGLPTRACRNARLDTQILLDKINGALDA